MEASECGRARWEIEEKNGGERWEGEKSYRRGGRGSGRRDLATYIELVRVGRLQCESIHIHISVWVLMRTHMSLQIAYTYDSKLLYMCLCVYIIACNVWYKVFTLKKKYNNNSYEFLT